MKYNKHLEKYVKCECSVSHSSKINTYFNHPSEALYFFPFLPLQRDNHYRNLSFSSCFSLWYGLPLCMHLKTMEFSLVCFCILCKWTNLMDAFMISFFYTVSYLYNTSVLHVAEDYTFSWLYSVLLYKGTTTYLSYLLFLWSWAVSRLGILWVRNIMNICWYK